MEQHPPFVVQPIESGARKRGVVTARERDAMRHEARAFRTSRRFTVRYRRSVVSSVQAKFIRSHSAACSRIAQMGRQRHS